MQMAVDATGHLTLARHAQKQQVYYCPTCGQPLMLRRGQQKPAYFAHQRACTPRAGGETAEHQQGKQQIMAWATSQGWQPQAEVYLPMIQQRPDVLVTINSRQVALEFQCSALSLARLQERNRGYARLGIQPVWFLGQPYQRSLHRAKQAQFTQLYHGRPCLYYWQVTRGQLTWQTGQITPVATVAPRQVSRDVTWLQGNSTSSAATRQLLGALYQAGHIGVNCPLVAHYQETNWPLIDESLLAWHLRQLLALEQVVLGTTWSWAGWWTFLTAQTTWLPLPCLTPPQVAQLHHQLLQAWTVELAQAGIVTQRAAGVQYCRRPAWFASYAAKVRAVRGWAGKEKSPR